MARGATLRRSSSQYNNCHNFSSRDILLLAHTSVGVYVGENFIVVLAAASLSLAHHAIKIAGNRYGALYSCLVETGGNDAKELGQSVLRGMRHKLAQSLSARLPQRLASN